MKSLILLTALLGLTLSVQAADPAPSKGSKKTDPAPAAKTEEKPAGKPEGFNHKVDAIDAAAKTITYTVKKTGVKETSTVTEKTTIMQGSKPATFDEIKVGDVVSGSRIKTGDATYDIVKITKFVSDSDKEKKPTDKTTATDTPAPAPASKKSK